MYLYYCVIDIGLKIIVKVCVSVVSFREIVLLFHFFNIHTTSVFYKVCIFIQSNF